MRRLFFLLLKATISLLLLYLSLRSVDLGSVGGRLANLSPGWIALALVLLAAQIFLVSLRWREIARACGTTISYTSSVQINFVASFFNQVLPSTVGGDAVRIWLLGRKGGGWASAAYSVLIDRVIGVLMLAVIVLLSLPWSLELISDPLARTVLVLIGASAVFGFAVFLAFGFLPQRYEHWAPLRHLAHASRVALTLSRDWRDATLVTVCSLAIHLLTVTVAWCCLKAFAAPAGFTVALVLMPPVLLIVTMPISIAGWGVRETSMVVAFAYAGLSQTDGLTLSILYGASTFAVGAIGGVVWIASGLKIGHAPQVDV